MQVVAGSVDPLGRPLLRVSVGGHEVLSLVDTGFNRSLLVSRSMANELALRPYGKLIVDRIQTVGLLGEISELMRGHIDWFGERRLVNAHVVEHEPAGRVDGIPLAILGTELFVDAVLTIDFPKKLVQVAVSR